MGEKKTLDMLFRPYEKGGNTKKEPQILREKRKWEVTETVAEETKKERGTNLSTGGRGCRKGTNTGEAPIGGGAPPYK